MELPVRSRTNRVGDCLGEGAEVAACSRSCIWLARLNGSGCIGQPDLRTAYGVVTWDLVFRVVEDVVALCPEFDVLRLIDWELLR